MARLRRASRGGRHGCGEAAWVVVEVVAWMLQGRRCATALPEVAARASRGGLDVPVVHGLDVYPILTCVHFILSSHIIF